MFHYTIGHIGHLSVITAFVSAIITAIAYYQASINDIFYQKWIKFARGAFFIHAISVVSIVVCLFIIIYNHYYEYYYAWSHSSNNLPVEYMISCFWEGQEGSFLLWMFWHVVLGIAMLATLKHWEAPVFTVFAAVQAFLASMILGVVIGDVKFGSSPFILLREFMSDAPIFKINPEFVPADGTGLNPLLQNYWMVIHPPTLFLGFAATLVPFSFCIAGLWKNKVHEWVKPATPWTHFAALVLGMGIIMGGYWAYETLNFGGYWNWDPVENAVYVPWLVLVASIHSFIIYKKNPYALRTAALLTVTAFILILYSTFLTRSGILGNASVHSFTDLGLSGQLLVYLLFFVAVSGFFLVKAWKQMPSNAANTSMWSADFWIFLGISALCLMGFQVLATTSIPVYNAILNAIGISSNLALPADQVAHYNKFQLWFAVAIALLSGTAQFFYWKKQDAAQLQKSLYTPVIITLLLVTIAILVTQVNKPEFIVLLLSAVYTVVANVVLLINIVKNTPRALGGTVAHIGMALMLIGILYSGGYSKVVSKNTTGLLYSKEFSTEMNQDNVLLWRNQPFQMGDYTAKYTGVYVQPFYHSEYINKEKIRPTETAYKAIITEDISPRLKKGDTIQYMPENTYYKVEVSHKGGQMFYLYPRAQVNKEMGLLASPDIKKFADKDLYAHVSSIPDPQEKPTWSELETKNVAIGDTFLVHDYYAILSKVERITGVEEIPLLPGDAAVKATINILTKDGSEPMHPIFVIHNQMVGRISDENLGLGIRLTLMNIEPKTGTFTVGINTTQKDWIILKAMEKPHINLLWLGSVMVMAGFGIAIYRRAR